MGCSKTDTEKRRRASEGKADAETVSIRGDLRVARNTKGRAGKRGRARLIFVIGVPQRLVNDYLVCVGALARLLKDDIVRNRLLNADTPEQFIEILRTGTE